MKLGVQLNSFDWEEGPERFATRLAKIAARMAKALPRWISWLGIVQATLAILSLASLVFFPAAPLILLGRVLGFVWSIAVGLVLAFDKQREPGAVG
jgi:uncharacterized protein involved in cysteine biosynthesis